MENTGAKQKAKITEKVRLEDLNGFSQIFQPLVGYGWVTAAMEAMDREERMTNRGVCAAKH